MHKKRVCAKKNHWITLPRNTTTEWFGHSAGEAPTQCEVQLFVRGKKKKKLKKKSQLRKSDTREGRGLL